MSNTKTKEVAEKYSSKLDNDKDDIMADFTETITSSCARLYSKQRGKNKADALKKCS